VKHLALSFPPSLFQILWNEWYEKGIISLLTSALLSNLKIALKISFGRIRYIFSKERYCYG
jgi:hypothetical protein